jgi:hypothetical protein
MVVPLQDALPINSSDEIGGARPKDSNRPNSQLVMPKSSVEHSIKQDLNRISSDGENDIGKSIV